MNPINTAILKGDFELAKTLLCNGESWEGLPSHAYHQAYDRIITKEAFDLLDVFIEKELLSLDIFDYSNFDFTVFSTFSKIPWTEKTSAYLDTFLPRIENFDEELMGTTWLGYSIKKNSSVDFLQKLIDHGADSDWLSSSGENYLFFTMDVMLTDFLLGQGLNVNLQNNAGNTVLFSAVEKRKAELIQLYLDHGAECNIQNNTMETPFQRVLFHAMDPKIFDLLNNHEPIRLDLKNKRNQTILFEFANYGPFTSETEIKLAEKLIENGADLYLSEKNIYEQTLTSAEVLSKKSLKLFEMIVEQEVFDADFQDDNGNTWLHYVCGENLNYDQRKAQDLYKKVKILLKKGVDPHIKNDEDKSPIDLLQQDDLKSKALSLLLKH